MAETESEGANAPGVERGETQGEMAAHPTAHYLPPNEREEGTEEGERDKELT